MSFQTFFKLLIKSLENLRISENHQTCKTCKTFTNHKSTISSFIEDIDREINAIVREQKTTKRKSKIKDKVDQYLERILSSRIKNKLKCSDENSARMLKRLKKLLADRGTNVCSDQVHSDGWFDYGDFGFRSKSKNRQADTFVHPLQRFSYCS